MAGAKAYVAYAQAHPGMYGLMFRTERLDMTRPSLHEAASASFAGLAGAVGVSRQEQISDEALSLEQAAAIARAWSLVHGFTMLLLDGRLTDILQRLPKGNDAETLLDAMLRSTVGRPPGSRDQRRFASSTRAAAFADHLHLVLAAFEAARGLVGGLAGEFVGVGIGLHVDIGDMAHRAGRQPRHRQQRFCDRPAVLVLVGIVGDVPALDDGEGLAVQRPPFDGVGGRIERTEPALRGRLLRSAAARLRPTETVSRRSSSLIDHHQPGLARADPDRGIVDAVAGAADAAILRARSRCSCC